MNKHARFLLIVLGAPALAGLAFWLLAWEVGVIASYLHTETANVWVVEATAGLWIGMVACIVYGPSIDAPRGYRPPVPPPTGWSGWKGGGVG